MRYTLVSVSHKRRKAMHIPYIQQSHDSHAYHESNIVDIPDAIARGHAASYDCHTKGMT